MSETARVFVSGCFDLLHAGHVAFLESAADFGYLTVCLGNDQIIQRLKGRSPIYSLPERQALVSALRCVDRVLVGSGEGWLDFEPELRYELPQRFVVNADGDRPEKRALCQTLGIEYIVLDRAPLQFCRPHSTTNTRAQLALPYRVDLAGGWLDQPFVSQQRAGPVIVASLEPSSLPYQHRAGLATSTRETATKLWGERLPLAPLEQSAGILFACENPPGKLPISGSQDAIGIVYPGINRLNYTGDFWPQAIESCIDDAVLSWLESQVWLIPTQPRPESYDVLADANVSCESVRLLANAAERCWLAIREQRVDALASAITASFEAQVAMFPNMLSPVIKTAIASLPKTVRGYKVAGAGGGGYLICIADSPPAGALPVRIRRAEAL